MNRKAITGLLIACLISFGAQAENFEGALTIKDAKIAPGGKTTLSVQLTNNADISGFSFKVALPEGLSATGMYISSERITNAGLLSYETLEGNVFSCAYVGTESFSGTSGEIATITLQAADDVTKQVNTVTITHIEVGGQTDTNATYAYDLVNSTFSLTVEDIIYTEGYSVEVMPFAYTGSAVYAPILMTNAKAITKMAFDVVLPSFFTNNDLCIITPNLDALEFTTSSTSNSNEKNISIVAGTGYNVASGSNTTIVRLGFKGYTSEITAGVYPISINNIVLTDADGNTYNAQPYTTEIYIGTSPKVVTSNGVAAFHGNYSNEAGYDLMFKSLPTGGTIDLTEVSAMYGDPTALKTDNVIVSNDKVAYGRTVNGYQWATLCLPFAIEPNEDIKLYQISEASDNTLTLSPIESAPANTPVICKVTEDARGFAFSASKDGTFNINYAANSVNPTANPIDNWSIIGSYHSENITTTNSYTYAINNDQFLRVTQQLTTSPFRAYLVSTVELGAYGAPIRIIEGTEGIEEIEQDNGVVTLSFDLQGRRVNDETRNNLVIENGQVKFIK